jgi:hypothetical protein
MSATSRLDGTFKVLANHTIVVIPATMATMVAAFPIHPHTRSDISGLPLQRLFNQTLSPFEQAGMRVAVSVAAAESPPHIHGHEPDLSDEESAALIRELDRIIQDDRYPLSPRIITLNDSE